MGMTVEQFLGTIKEGWRVVIGTKSPVDPVSGLAQLQSARIQDATSRNYFDVTPVDGQVDAGQVYQALAFLKNVPWRAGRDDGAQNRLVLAFLAADRSHPPPLPDGMRYAAAPDGSTSITDDRGTSLGTIASGASMAEAGDAVVGAMAAGAAEGLMSSPSKVLPASSGEMTSSAVIASAEIDALMAALEADPGERPPLPADPTADDIARLKAAQTAERQQQLQSEITNRLVGKGVVKAKLLANDLAAVCQKYDHTFQRTGTDRQPGYQVKTSDGELVASGTLQPAMWGRSAYLSPGAVRRLLDQLDEADLKNMLAGIPPDAVEEVHEADQEVEKYAADHAEGSGDANDHDHHGDGHGGGPGVSTGHA